VVLGDPDLIHTDLIPEFNFFHGTSNTVGRGYVLMPPDEFKLAEFHLGILFRHGAH
jgi:hypothetical protein